MPSSWVFIPLIAITVTLHVYLILQYEDAVREMTYWRPNSNRKIAHYIDLDDKATPINLCRHETTLLILVHSNPRNAEARVAIRATWGSKAQQQKHNTSMFFLLGQSTNSSLDKSVNEESESFEDIIIENFVDSYSNLTLKSVLMLKLFTHGKKCRFLLKTDEDVFVSIHSIVKFLKPKNGSLLVGRLIKKEKRRNDYNSQWYAPKYMYLRHTYPEFLAGPAYAMSFDVAQKLYETALQEPLFHLEDVFLTGICAKKANIKRTHNSLFIDFTISRNECLLRKLFTVHGLNPSKLRKVQIAYEKLKSKCLK